MNLEEDPKHTKSKLTSLPDLCIRRPVLATVMSLVIVFAGLIAYFRLPVREYPDIDPPVVTITTVYPGANSKVIETEITDLIEEEVSAIEGVKSLISTSRDQVSSIIIEFVLERDIDVAAQDVRDKVSRIRSRLPENVDEPIIAKTDADASPVMWVKVQSEKRGMIELAEYVDKEIKDYFQNVPGVSKVIFGGDRRRSIQVFIDPKRMAYYGVTILEVQNALRSSNIEIPAGSILSTNKEFSINVNAKLSTVEGYQDIIIKDSSNEGSRSKSRASIIRLRDIADVKIAAENDKSFIRFNGIQGFGLGIVRQSKANSIQISDDINALVKRLQAKIPSDIKLEIGYDSAQFIRLSLEELTSSIIQASLLVLLVIFIFLRNLRSTFIPGIAIPISLIGVMIGVYALGFTINQMTLLGLIISVGIVVDDSIIVLENVYRYIEEGEDPKVAAKKGTEEITLAVIATTMVLVAIFLPIGFLSGITGRLLSEFAFSLCFATLISAFVSLTLAPMLCSKILQSTEERKNKEPKKGFYKKTLDVLEGFLNWLESSYEKSLNAIMEIKKPFVTIIIAICLPLMVFLYITLPKDFIPDEDRGQFLVVFESPRGSSLQVLDKQIRKAENLLLTIPEVKTIISVAAFGIDAPGKATSGVIIARLVDWDERSRKVGAIVGPLYPQFFMMPETFALPIIPKSGPSSGFGSQPIQLVIKSNNLDFLVKASAEVTRKVSTLPQILFAKSNLTLDKPELTVDINRDKASSLGVSIEDISRSLELLFAGVQVTEFNDIGEKYEVILKLPQDQRNNVGRIGEFAVKGRSGNLVQLSNLITVKETVGAEELNHYNRKKAVTIGASPQPGVTPTDGLNALETLTRDVIKNMKDVPPDVEIDYMGASKETHESSNALVFGFLVALIFAYLFLAGQFESFTNPLIIMVTVPLALTGALIGLWVFQIFPFGTKILVGILGPSYAWLPYVIPQFPNISLNIYSQIGMIMLIGIATKNGILLVEFMNILKERGLPLNQVVIDAAKLRLRPILMTAICTVLGTLPIALAMGVGTESRQSLGICIIFGLCISTLLTLYVIPAVYWLVNHNKTTK